MIYGPSLAWGRAIFVFGGLRLLYDVNAEDVGELEQLVRAGLRFKPAVATSLHDRSLDANAERFLLQQACIAPYELELFFDSLDAGVVHAAEVLYEQRFTFLVQSFYGRFPVTELDHSFSL